MGMSTNQPKNLNELAQNKFKLVFKRLPNVTYFGQEVNIPGVSMTPIESPSPVNNLPLGGNKVRYEELQINFIVDEDLRNYLEIHDWIVGIGAPQTPQQFQELIKTNPYNIRMNDREYNIFSDASLIIVTNVMQPNVTFNFKNIFPISLSSIPFTTKDASTQVATATFVYESFSVETKD